MRASRWGKVESGWPVPAALMAVLSRRGVERSLCVCGDHFASAAWVRKVRPLLSEVR